MPQCDLAAMNKELVEYKEKVVQLDNQLRVLLQDTNKSSVVRLTEVSDEIRPLAANIQ